MIPITQLTHQELKDRLAYLGGKIQQNHWTSNCQMYQAFIEAGEIAQELLFPGSTKAYEVAAQKLREAAEQLAPSIIIKKGVA